MAYPTDKRNYEDEVKSYYNDPLRAEVNELIAENLRLKTLLRLNHVPWSAKPENSGNVSGTSVRKLPALPVEIVLKILRYALTSPTPIIDPFCKHIDRQDLTVQENTRSNQIAISFLATCKAYHIEGTRIFGEVNQFTFTSPGALRKFCTVDLARRQQVRHINLRIIARHYDTNAESRRKLDADYHPELMRSILYPVTRVVQGGNGLGSRGYHCYAWTQVVDFLTLLQPPYVEPKQTERAKSNVTTRSSAKQATSTGGDITGTGRNTSGKSQRPVRKTAAAAKKKTTKQPAATVQAPLRLFPNLNTMQIDFVNFPSVLTGAPLMQMHYLCHHELASTLHELCITGLPDGHLGQSVAEELSGLVRDNGLWAESEPLYMQLQATLQSFKPASWMARVIRPVPGKENGEDDVEANSSTGPAGSHPNGPCLTGIRIELGSPSSWPQPYEGEKVAKQPDTNTENKVWRRVLTMPGSEKRGWVEFDRKTGLPQEFIVADADVGGVLDYMAAGNPFNHFDISHRLIRTVMREHEA